MTRSGRRTKQTNANSKIIVHDELRFFVDIEKMLIYSHFHILSIIWTDFLARPPSHQSTKLIALSSFNSLDYLIYVIFFLPILVQSRDHWPFPSRFLFLVQIS